LIEFLPEALVNRLADLLAQSADLATLPDTELAARRTQLEEAIAEAGEGAINADVTALMAQADAQVEAIEGEQTTRSDIAAQLRAEADAVLEKARARKQKAEGGGDNADAAADAGDGAAPEATADGAGAGDGGADGGDAVTTGGGADGAGEGAGDAGDAAGGETPAPQAVAASQQRPPIERDITIPARNRPLAQTSHPVIQASGEVRGVSAGHVFGSVDELHEAMFDRWSTMRTSADGHMHYMGTVDYREMYPPELRIESADPHLISDQVMREVRRRIETQARAREEFGSEYESMVASGGVPGPAEPRYQQITYGQARRPLRDALPGFLANRGAIIFNASPTLADIVLDTSGGAVGTITNAQDISGTPKTIQEISAPTPTTVTVEAEVLRFSQGNFADRFYPERTRAFMALGQVAFARHNEALRLNDIKNGSVQWTDTPAKFGAYRDLKRTFFAVLEELEDLVRDFEQQFTVLMPEFVPALIASDLIAQGFGDDGWKATVGAVKADMQSWAPNAQITFLYDSIRGRLSTTPSGQSPRTPGYDTDVEWCIFPTGTWLYLDGGQLDLGIIRDSATSQLNKFQTFFEQWEAVARIAPLSFWITNSLCANGLAQIPATVALGCEGGS
jgi:hypothetical protein